MRAKIIWGILAFTCSLIAILPSFASKAASYDNAVFLVGDAEPARIGVSLPLSVSRTEMMFARQTLESKGYEVALYYFEDWGQDQIAAMLEDGCNVIIVGATDGRVLDEQMLYADQHGVEIQAYGSMLMHSDRISLDSEDIQADYLELSASGSTVTLAPGLTRIELFSGVCSEVKSGSEVHKAVSEIVPLIENAAMVVRSEFVGRSIVESLSTGGGDLIAAL